MMSTSMTMERVIRRDRIVVLWSAACVVTLSWIFLFQDRSLWELGREVVLSHAQTLGLRGAVLTFLMWMVMMVAMMLPAVMPWILLFAVNSRNRDATTPPYLSTSLFVAGYFAIWAVFSLGAALAQLTLQHQALLRADLKAGPYAAGALLLVAGLFQLTPLKSACLRHCRSPLGFLLSHWRDGARGAFHLGFRHGVFCLGCCWALMALSFALGVMNQLWMAVLVLIICVEKVAPSGDRLSRVFGMLFAAWGLWVFATAGVS